VSDKKEATKLFTMKIPQSKLLKYKKLAELHDLPLSQLIQKLLDGQDLPKRVRPRKVPTADPELVRQIAAIGNNLNQIARRINRGDKFDVVPHLLTIEYALKDLLDAHQIHQHG